MKTKTRIFIVLLTMSLLTLCLYCNASITISPTNLNGVNDTAYCQHGYSVKFIASGGTAPYKYSFGLSNILNGVQLDSLTGILSGRIGYVRDTDLVFIIKAKDKLGNSGQRSYTLHVRNKFLTRHELVQLWSRSQYPQYSTVYDTYHNTLSLARDTDQSPTIDTSGFWNILGNSVSDDNSKIGTSSNNDLNVITNNSTRLLITKNANFVFNAVATGISGTLTLPDITGADTLVSGTLLVLNSHVTANSIILFSPQSTSLTAGGLDVSSRVPGVSFTITSTSATDNRKIGWLIVEP